MSHALVLNPSPKKKAPRKKNPAGLVEERLVPALTGGASAVASNIAMDYVVPYLPEQLQTGIARTMTEGAMILAVGVGLEKGKLIKDKKLRNRIIDSSLTVVAYKGISDFLADSGMMPAGETGMYQRPNMGMYQKPGMGMYQRVTPRKSSSNMGYLSPTLRAV